MDKIELAFKSLEDIFSNISDEELNVLVNEVDTINEEGFSVEEYFSMVMSDYHHTFIIDSNNPISNKILDNYKIVGGVFKQTEKIKLKCNFINPITFLAPKLKKGYNDNDNRYDIAA